MPKILVIDDEEDLREALRNVLESEGHEVHEAQDSAGGLAKLLEVKPDLVLLDVRLGGLDSGVRVLARIREDHKGLPVIMISGWGSEETFEELISHGARACVRKPFDNHKLAALIRRTLCEPPPPSSSQG